MHTNYGSRSREEYKILVKNFRENEVAAVKELYQEGIWWSALVSKKYLWVLDPLDGLETMMMIGFSGWLQAIEHYKTGADYKLSTYVTWWIRQAICEAFAIPIDDECD